MVVKKMTKYTDKLREERESPQMQEFKKRVETFLKKGSVDLETQYHLKSNLAAKINLPYYGESKGKRPKNPYNHFEIVLAFCKYLIRYDNLDFTKELLDKLTIQQNQSLRKIAKRRKDINRLPSKNAIWEHIIPVNVVKNRVLEIIGCNATDNEKLKLIENTLTIYEMAGQIHITREDDKKLKNSKYNESMPSDWDWTEGKIFSRYVESGIDLKQYIED